LSDLGSKLPTAPAHLFALAPRQRLTIDLCLRQVIDYAGKIDEA